MQKLRTLFVFAAILLAGGCDSVYFYETEKASLTLEARPDVTAPIQGNIGVKQRIVALVPPGNSTAAATLTSTQLDIAAQVLADSKKALAAGDIAMAQKKYVAYVAMQNELTNSDAMSVLSSLRFHKYPKPDGSSFFEFGRVTIDAALITGNAARVVSNPSAAIQNLSGTTLKVGTSLQQLSVLETIYSAIKGGTDQSAKTIKADLDATTSNLPDAYPAAIYGTDATKATDIQTIHKAGDSVMKRDFRDVITYLRELQNTSAVVPVLNKPTFTVDGSAPTVSALAISETVTQTIASGNALNQKIQSSPAVQNAIIYFFGTAR
jgi:hypothetical protein